MRRPRARLLSSYTAGVTRHGLTQNKWPPTAGDGSNAHDQALLEVLRADVERLNNFFIGQVRCSQRSHLINRSWSGGQWPEHRAFGSSWQGQHRASCAIIRWQLSLLL